MRIDSFNRKAPFLIGILSTLCYGQAPGPALTSAVSRKLHGTSGTLAPFDITIPLNGSPVVEGRTNWRDAASSSALELILTFSTSVKPADGTLDARRFQLSTVG